MVVSLSSAVACEALQSLLRITDQTQPEALSGVLGATCNTVTILALPQMNVD
jgi:hypothetical protein